MAATRLTAARFVGALSARGRHHFTTAEAAEALRGTTTAVRAALRRLQEKGELATPYRGFYVIVPPEYRRLGCLPAEQFIAQLMGHLGETYYIALLSAAELHGAAHQRPQALQVMVTHNRKPLACGAVRVLFAARYDLAHTPVVEKNTPRGPVRVSSVEATALELVGYANHCGGLDNVATVLAELVENVDADRLAAVARLCPIAWAQRLGFLLELVGHGTVADKLRPQVTERAKSAALLVRANPRAGGQYHERWRLVVNAEVEPDL